jgi:hypothetical protein
MLNVTGERPVRDESHRRLPVGVSSCRTRPRCTRSRNIGFRHCWRKRPGSGSRRRRRRARDRRGSCTAKPTMTRSSSVDSTRPSHVRTCCLGRQSCHPAGPGSSRGSLRSDIRSLVASQQSGSIGSLPSRGAPPRARHGTRRHTMDRHFAVAYTAIEQRRRALAAAATFGAGRRDSIVQPGGDEALACLDARRPAPVQSSPTVRLWARLVIIMRSLAPNKPARLHAVIPAHASGIHARHAVPNIRSRINFRIQRSR